MDGVRLTQGWNENHFEKVVHVLPLSSQKLLVFIFLSNFEGRTTKIPKSDPRNQVSILI